jgi:heat shock protein HtpX
MPRVFISPDSSPNAFATGRTPEKAKICLHKGLLDRLGKSELEGVIAHELSHIKNRDILVMTVTMVLASVVSFVADMGFQLMFWGGLGGSKEGEGNKSPVILVVYVLTLILAPLVATVIQLAVSRQREFLADATAVVLTRYPEGLKKALIKLHKDPAPNEHYSTAMSHFYIAPPKKTFGEKVETWFSTHPSLKDRVAALEEM